MRIIMSGQDSCKEGTRTVNAIVELSIDVSPRDVDRLTKVMTERIHDVLGDIDDDGDFEDDFEAIYPAGPVNVNRN